MKENIKAALEKLNAASTDVRPGTRAETDFKDAIVLLEKAYATPEPAPKTVIQTEIVTGDVANQVATQIQGFMDTVQSSLVGLTSRVINLESATASVVTVTQATLDHVDGFQDVLGVIVSNTTPADPAPAA